MKRFEPAYLQLLCKGEFEQRVAEARKHLACCDLCPRICKADRLSGETGFCGVKSHCIVSSVFPHFGEEPELVGLFGSGTVFLSGCNLRCLFCQNHEISWDRQGQEFDAEDLASAILSLQERGCHNINFVTPSHCVPQIIEAVFNAASRGLCVPIVYNSSGYDSLTALTLLDGIVDIYMPDLKYGRNKDAEELSQAVDYVTVSQAALREMHRQVGDLVINGNGIAQRGLLVRHLILPEDLAGTQEVMRFLAKLSRETYVNIMDQYRPAWRATEKPVLGRRIRQQEYDRAITWARECGLHRGFQGI